MLRSSKRATVAGLSSTLSLANRTRPAISNANSSIAGAMIRHGPHHGAHASTSTGSGDRSTSPEKLASVTVTGWLWTGSGVLHRPHTGSTPWAIFSGGTRLVVPQAGQRIRSGSAVPTAPASERLSARPPRWVSGQGERASQHLVRVVDEDERELPAQVFWHVLHVALVSPGQDHLADPGAVRGEDLLLDAADGQHLAAQRNLARHRHVALHWTTGGERGERRHHGHSRRGPVLGHGARRNVHVNGLALERFGIDPERLRVRP